MYYSFPLKIHLKVRETDGIQSLATTLDLLCQDTEGPEGDLYLPGSHYSEMTW